MVRLFKLLCLLSHTLHCMRFFPSLFPLPQPEPSVTLLRSGLLTLQACCPCVIPRLTFSQTGSDFLLHPMASTLLAYLLKKLPKHEAWDIRVLFPGVSVRYCVGHPCVPSTLCRHFCFDAFLGNNLSQSRYTDRKPQRAPINMLGHLLQWETSSKRESPGSREMSLH